MVVVSYINKTNQKKEELTIKPEYTEKGVHWQTIDQDGKCRMVLDINTTELPGKSILEYVEFDATDVIAFGLTILLSKTKNIVFRVDDNMSKFKTRFSLGKPRFKNNGIEYVETTVEKKVHKMEKSFKFLVLNCVVKDDEANWKVVCNRKCNECRIKDYL